MPTSTPRPALSSRERVNRMFARQDHDRVPRHDSYWKETISRWQAEGLEGSWQEIYALLGNDIKVFGGTWPVPFPGRKVVLAEDDLTRTVSDEWGMIARYWKHKSGTPEHVGFECKSRDDWERITKPAMLAHAGQVNFETVNQGYARGRAADQWCCLTCFDAFEATRRLIGDEVTLMAMVEDPEWVVDISRTFCDLTLANLQAILDTGKTSEGLWIYGDMAFKTGTMCSPQMYRELIWPDHKRMADWAHARGMKVIFHSDGDIRGVIDLYKEAGFDCLQPLESRASMDVRRLCPEHGRELAFFGNIDVMVMGSNDRDRIEHEVATKLAAGKAAKGYAYHSDHSIPPTVSWETYRFIISLLEKYGSYEP